MGIIMGFMAVWMNFYVITSCKFALITELNPVTGEPILMTKRGYGLLAREIRYGEKQSHPRLCPGCIVYPNEEEDALQDFWLRSARGVAFIGAFLGLITFTCLCGASCVFCESWNFERWLLWCCIWASICMAFTNLIFGNWFCAHNQCKVSYGTGYAVTAFMTYLMLANQIKSMAQPPPRSAMPPAGGREDDLWYDNEDDRFLQDDEEDDDDNNNDNDDDGDDNTNNDYELETFEDENNDDKQQKRPRKLWGRNLRRNKNKKNNEEGTFVNNNSHDNYDELKQYMQPEDKYVPPQDEDFLERDKEHQDRLYQEKVATVQPQQQPYHQQQSQPMPRYYPESTNTRGTDGSSMQDGLEQPSAYPFRDDESIISPFDNNNNSFDPFSENQHQQPQAPQQQQNRQQQQRYDDESVTYSYQDPSQFSQNQYQQEQQHRYGGEDESLGPYSNQDSFQHQQHQRNPAYNAPSTRGGGEESMAHTPIYEEDDNESYLGDHSLT